MERKKSVASSLRALGLRFYNQMARQNFPWVKIKSRSISNIYYDSALKQFVLGHRTIKRSAKYVRHLRPLTQLVWTANFAYELLKEGKTSTLRDVFYSSQAYDVPFKDQMESDNIIMDLEAIAGCAREDFNIFPEERSAIFGDLTIEYTSPGYKGKRLNLLSHPDGMMVGPALMSAKLIETAAERVIVIEKGAMFSRLIEEEAHKKFKAILIHTAGQPPRATRYLLRRLNTELDLPVFIFTDGDPWGMHIAMVIISGSIGAAHLRKLTVPDAKWTGVWATDIIKYRLSSERLNERDIKRLLELQKDPRYKGLPWEREIKTFLQIKKKAEQEAFSRYGLSYIVDKYLPEKIF